MKGYIDEHRHPLIKIKVKGIRKETEIYAIVDSGFDGEVCLPLQIAISLGLELRGAEFVELADGTTKRELMFEGSIEWDGQFRDVRISLTNARDALIGTGLLIDKILTMNFCSREVHIEQCV